MSRMVPARAFVILIACRVLSAHIDSPLADLQTALSSHDLQAIRTTETSLLSGDKTLDTLLNAGVLLAQNDMLADAARLFEHCAKRFPSSFEAKYNLALSLIGLNNYADATTTLDSTSAQSSPKMAAVEYLRGKIYAATGHPAQARQCLEKAYRTNPGEENYSLELALLYIRQSAYVPAIQILQPVRLQNPESIELTLELALAESLSGQSTSAISLCRELLQKDSSQSMARVIAAFSLCFEEHYAACETESSAGLSLPHPNSYLHYLHAEALWYLNAANHSGMLAELTTAIQNLPACTACLLLRSKILEADYQKQPAIADLKTALAQDPKLAQAWYLLSHLYKQTGQASEASEALRHYRALKDQQANQEIEAFRKQFVESVDTK